MTETIPEALSVKRAMIIDRLDAISLHHIEYVPTLVDALMAARQFFKSKGYSAAYLPFNIGLDIAYWNWAEQLSACDVEERRKFISLAIELLKKPGVVREEPEEEEDEEDEEKPVEAASNTPGTPLLPEEEQRALQRLRKAVDELYLQPDNHAERVVFEGLMDMQSTKEFTRAVKATMVLAGSDNGLKVLKALIDYADTHKRAVRTEEEF